MPARKPVEEVEEEKSPNGASWIAVSLIAVVVLAVGVAVGFIVGNQRGLALNAREAAQAKELAQKADEAIVAADARTREAIAERDGIKNSFDAEVKTREDRTNEAVKQSETAQKRATEAEGRYVALQTAIRDGENKRQKLLDEGLLDENEVLQEFLDKPKGFQNKVITARLQYASVGVYNLRDFVSFLFNDYPEQNKDFAFVPFVGRGPAGSKLEITIGFSKKFPLADIPNAARGDELIITFACATSDKSDSPICTGLCKKVIRPKK